VPITARNVGAALIKVGFRSMLIHGTLVSWQSLFCSDCWKDGLYKRAVTGSRTSLARLTIQFCAGSDWQCNRKSSTIYQAMSFPHLMK